MTVELADPDALRRATATLRAGGTVVLPTDTVYGLAALPTVDGATTALSTLKARALDQPFAVLVADVDQALDLIEAPTDAVRRWMADLWPGPLTIVARRSPAASGLALGGTPETIGVRCPAHDFVRAVAAEIGAIATTSANRHAEPTPAGARQAAAALDGPVGLVIDGGPAGTVASTVVDATGDRWQILRPGAITDAALRALV